MIGEIDPVGITIAEGNLLVVAVMILQKPTFPKIVTIPVDVHSPVAGLVPVITLLTIKTKTPDLDRYP